MSNKLKQIKGIFVDSVTNLYNALINDRNALNTNVMTPTSRLPYEQMTEMYKTGLGSKIVRIKIGYALKNALQFASSEDEKFYNDPLPANSLTPLLSPAVAVKEACRWMLAYGRGIIVIQEPGVSLETPLRGPVGDPSRVWLRVWSGDLVSAPTGSIDLASPYYYRPEKYNVRGFWIHHSRVIDFTYVKPRELDQPVYQFGGYSEFELIRNQFINDGIIERSIASILEKNATLFYKVKGYKEKLGSDKAKDLIEFFRRIESGRSIYGSGIIDAEDDVEMVNQTLTNLSEVDEISLRRLALVTSIPLPVLVGENVKGMDATGDHEMQIFHDAEEVLQEDYMGPPINQLMAKLGRGPVTFNENQWDTATSRIEYDGKALDNATKMQTLGEDYKGYLEDKGIIKPRSVDDLFGDDDEGDGDQAIDPEAGAQ